jgi:hypothetical protein
MTFDKTNRGSIWPNKRKQQDTHPDFTGSINVDGKEYWLNGWRRKEGASPESPSMTFTVRAKEGRMPAAKTDGHSVQPRGRAEGRASLDDEIPFLMEWR